VVSSCAGRADRDAPTIGRVFLEYAQYRGFVVDPAVPRHATGKPKAERGKPFDRPTWARCTVHPDHHIQFRRGLYSVLTRHIGQALEVRGDSRLVHLYHHGDLIKVQASQPAGGRATDYADYPAERTPYALRGPDRCIDQAQRLGPAAGQFITVLLGGTFLWARLRQAQKLLRLAERYGPNRINAACAQGARLRAAGRRARRSDRPHRPGARARGWRGRARRAAARRFTRAPESFTHPSIPQEHPDDAGPDP
jgi:hypothetical protein